MAATLAIGALGTLMVFSATRSKGGPDIVDTSFLRKELLFMALGVTGMVAMTRLMGFLMICIGVQFIINGLTAITADPSIWAGLAEAVRQVQP